MPISSNAHFWKYKELHIFSMSLNNEIFYDR
ncbi:Uncharacterised protein [Klebsiella pneumoniae]|nr:Uncharacterised protein [Klebsiella pneumoniae]